LLKSTGRTAVCIKRANIPQFNEKKHEVEKFLEASKQISISLLAVVDPYDYLWIVILSKTIDIWCRYVNMEESVIAKSTGEQEEEDIEPQNAALFRYLRTRRNYRRRRLTIENNKTNNKMI
jgi:hypothetical protein